MIGTGQMVIDSATWENYPVRAFDLAITYIDGKYATPEHVKRQFRRVLPFTVLDAPGAWREAKVLDIENGAATVAQARPFVEDRKNNHGWRAGLYCSRDKVRAVAEACAGLDWFLCLSTLDGTIYEDYQGISVYLCQFAGFPAYDLSYLIGPLNFFERP
jgi:hypothetical protein